MRISSIYVNFYAVITSLATVYFTFNNYQPSHTDIVAIASPLATIAGMLFGFICASAIFLASNSTNELLRQLKSTKMLENLLVRIGATGLFLGFSCLFMILSVFMPNKIMLIYSVSFDYGCMLVGLFFLIYSMLEFVTCWGRIMKVVSKM